MKKTIFKGATDFWKIQNVFTYQGLAYRLLVTDAKLYIVSCSVLTLLLQHLSSPYQNNSTKYLNFLRLEFLDSDWFKIFREFNCKLHTAPSQILFGPK